MLKNPAYFDFYLIAAVVPFQNYWLRDGVLEHTLDFLNSKYYQTGLH